MIQYKAEDEYFLETGIEMAAIAKFLSVNKQVKDPTRATSTNYCESLISSIADDEMPEMKDMSKQIESKLKNEAPVNNYDAIADIMDTFEPVVETPTASNMNIGGFDQRKSNAIYTIEERVNSESMLTS